MAVLRCSENSPPLCIANNIVRIIIQKMIDRNNNMVSENESLGGNDALGDNEGHSDPSEGLAAWLTAHTDPYTNPWATDDWKQAGDIPRDEGDNDEDNDDQDTYPNCIDPTANRLQKCNKATTRVY